MKINSLLKDFKVWSKISSSVPTRPVRWVILGVQACPRMSTDVPDVQNLDILIQKNNVNYVKILDEFLIFSRNFFELIVLE